MQLISKIKAPHPHPYAPISRNNKLREKLNHYQKIPPSFWKAYEGIIWSRSHWANVIYPITLTPSTQKMGSLKQGDPPSVDNLDWLW